MEKNARVLVSEIRVTGPSTSSSKKQKVREELTHLTVQFEGLNGSECQKWWQETLEADQIKQILIWAQVHWAIQLPVFSIRLFESVLRTMIKAYSRHSRTSTFMYKKHQMTVSFKPRDFTRVFGIPRPSGKKVEIKNHKLSQERKEHWVCLVGCNLTPEERVSVVKGSDRKSVV